MSRSNQRIDGHAFHPGDARERAARTYVLLARPLLLVAVLPIVLAAWLRTPDQVLPNIWAGFTVMFALQVPFVMLARRGVNVRRLVDVELVVDLLIVCVIVLRSPNPLGTSTVFTFLVIVAAYFMSARATAAYTLAATIAIVAASQLVNGWPEPFVVPSTAFLTLTVGLVSTFIMSHVRRTEDQLEQVVAEQQRSLARLEQVGRVRDRLIVNVSHELRTPLTSTIGAIETLLRDDIQLEPAERTTLMRLARDGGHRLLALVEDLLTVGATRPDSLEMHAEPLDLGSLVRDAILEVERPEQRSLEVVEPASATVLADRLRLVLVIVNLVTNAIRHGAGDVEVQIDRAGEFGLLRVLDDGPGIAAEHLDELFLPFARFSTRADSTGLGLAICRALVEAQGGTISYSRNPDDRTCFCVQLPLAQPASA